MNIKDFLNKEVKWLNEAGPYADDIISSRVRLARNLAQFPFRVKQSHKQAVQLIEILNQALRQIPYLKNAAFFDLKTMEDVECIFLVERHLISKEHAENKGDRAVMISEGEVISIMINEEDHLRMQSMFSGLQLMECWRLINQIDDELQKQIKFAFSPQWGYLTSCPTNVGTGIRASVMMHLPCLVLTKQINKILQAASKMGLAVRGLYGEGTAAIGNFFQISNQITLGVSEEDVIDNVERISKQILQHEIQAREAIFKKERTKIEDRIWRAYGLLANSQLMTYKESIELLSTIRLGLSLGILDQNLNKNIRDLFLIVQPAHIQFLNNEKLLPEQRDMKRAELIRARFKV